jgi:glycosyltransferase involved in cell wall biosynthesis
MEQKRVLVVGPWTGAGGVHTFMRNLCIHSNLKEEWTFNRFNISRPPKTVSDNHQYTFLQSDPKRLLKSIVVTGNNALRYPLHVRNIDIVQIQSSDYYSFWESMTYAMIAKRLNKPVVVRFGGAFDHFYESSSNSTQKRIINMLSIPDAIIVQSSRWKKYFSQFISEDVLNIVPNAVPTPPPFPVRNPKNKLTALFICTNDAKRKGIDTIVEAIPHLREYIHFVFVAVNDSVRDMLHEKKVLKDIEVHDSVPRKRMKEHFYPRADIFLLPSHAEGFPNSMLEAMAAGLPIVTSPVGAIPDVLIPKVHGFLNDPSDSKALVRDVLFLVQNPTERVNMGKRCYDLVSSEYHLDSVFSRFDKLWKRLLKS